MIHYQFLNDGGAPFRTDLTRAVALGSIGRAVVRHDRSVDVHYVDDRQGQPMVITVVFVPRTGAVHDVLISA